jgi:hypothetical protein
MKNVKFQSFVPICFSVFFLLFGLLYNANGQRNLKYKDVMKAIEERGREEAYSLLLVYQKQDPYFANTYFQLGLISQFWSKDYDPLTNLRDVELFIYNTNLYYGLAISKIDQKEVRKNDKLYQNIDRFRGKEKIEFEEVKSFLQEQIDANEEYKKNVQVVYRLFNSSIFHYDNCRRIFKQINADNFKLKDLYLTANESFIRNLDELQRSFDSTIFYLQNFQTALKNYPIKNYNQKYKLYPIETYRLEGLTGSDFLQDEIPIWNYGAWVKSVKQTLNSEIQEIRTLVAQTDKELNENISFLADTREYSTDLKRYVVDEKIKYKVGKYDHQSLVLDLFDFKENKIAFLANLRDPLNNPKDTSQKFSLLQRSRFYADLINIKDICDSSNQNFSQKINPYDINKYFDFFSRTYGGEAGLKNYLKNDLVFLKSQLKSAFSNYKSVVIHSNTKTHTVLDSVKYKNIPLNFKQTNFKFENALPETCYVIDYSEAPSGDFYITGYLIEGNNPAYPFVARTNKTKDIKWLKVVGAPKTIGSYGVFVVAKDDGCEVLVHVPNDEISKNQIFNFDNEGKQKDKIDLTINFFPRFFSFDEINQTYTLAFKGDKSNQLECLDKELFVLKFDLATKSELWKHQLKLNGSFVNIIQMEHNLWVVSNFTRYESGTGQYSSNAGSQDQTNALLILIDQSGNINKEIHIAKDKPFFISNVLKLNSNTVNLLGFMGTLGDVKELTVSRTGELVYLLLNSSGGLYYDNTKN